MTLPNFLSLQAPRVAGFVLLAVIVSLTGCAEALRGNYARLRVESLQIPVLYKKQGIIISVDGQKFGPRYSSIRVPAGYHEVHAVFISCTLPILITTCFEGALEQIVPFEAVAGETYVLRRGKYSLWAEPEARREQRKPPL